jgi:hypothetical protein
LARDDAANVGRPARETSYFLKKEAKNVCSGAVTTRRIIACACAEPNGQKFFGSFF